jgi:hypothetical protein
LGRSGAGERLPAKHRQGRNHGVEERNCHESMGIDALWRVPGGLSGIEGIFVRQWRRRAQPVRISGGCALKWFSERSTLRLPSRAPRQP